MIDEIKKVLEKRNPSQLEFHQSVYEVLEDVEEFYNDNPKYRDYAVVERLIEPDRTVSFRVCWDDDQGKIHVNKGWRVQFNNSIGAYKGGLRFHPSVNESVLKFLAFEQCFKNCLTGLPMGGAKGGSDFNPKGKSVNEIRKFCQAFMQELYHYIGNDFDVPAGDINVGAREIGFLFGHYLKLTNRFEGAMTGKNPLFGGSCGRTEATGYGCIYFLESMLESHDKELKNKKIIISGSGNVALHAAEKCLHEKAKVLSLSDSKGTLYFKDGLSEEDLKTIKRIKLDEDGSLKEFSGNAEYKEGKKPWSIPADIALPCATQNELELDDAKELVKNNFTALAEGANMPLTREALDCIIDSQIIFGPAKAANAGGVAVSGLERTQNAEMRTWSLEKVDCELKEIMKNIHSKCIEYVDKVDGIYPYKKGANIASFKRLADVSVAYGTK